MLPLGKILVPAIHLGRAAMGVGDFLTQLLVFILDLVDSLLLTLGRDPTHTGMAWLSHRGSVTMPSPGMLGKGYPGMHVWGTRESVGAELWKSRDKRMGRRHTHMSWGQLAGFGKSDLFRA